MDIRTHLFSKDESRLSSILHYLITTTIKVIFVHVETFSVHACAWFGHDQTQPAHLLTNGKPLADLYMQKGHYLIHQSLHTGKLEVLWMTELSPNYLRLDVAPHSSFTGTKWLFSLHLSLASNAYSKPKH